MRNSDYSSACHLPNIIWSYLCHGWIKPWASWPSSRVDLLWAGGWTRCLVILVFLPFLFLFPVLFMMGGELVKKSKGLRSSYYFLHSTCIPPRSFVYSRRSGSSQHCDGSLQAISWVLLLCWCQESKAKLCWWKEIQWPKLCSEGLSCAHSACSHVDNQPGQL